MFLKRRLTSPFWKSEQFWKKLFVASVFCDASFFKELLMSKQCSCHIHTRKKRTTQVKCWRWSVIDWNRSDEISWAIICKIKAVLIFLARLQIELLKYISRRIVKKGLSLFLCRRGIHCPCFSFFCESHNMSWGGTRGGVRSLIAKQIVFLPRGLSLFLRVVMVSFCLQPGKVLRPHLIFHAKNAVVCPWEADSPCQGCCGLSREAENQRGVGSPSLGCSPECSFSRHFQSSVSSQRSDNEQKVYRRPSKAIAIVSKKMVLDYGP